MIKVLSIILGVQLLLIAIFWFGSGLSADQSAPTSLLGDLGLVDKMKISDMEHQLVLQKNGEQWQMPEHENLPAPQADSLLDKLSALQTRWPVATTGQAAERFEVSEKRFQKKIAFYQGENLWGTLYIGTSPGFRKVHARLDKQNDVYAVEFSTHEAGTDVDDWLDKGLLRITGDIKKVSSEGLTLIQEGENWIISPLAENYETDSAAVKRWLGRFKRIQVSQLAVEEKSAEIVKQTPKRQFTLIADDVETQFQFYQSDEDFYVKSSANPCLFKISKPQAEMFIDLNVEEFQKSLTEPEGIEELDKTPEKNIEVK